MRREYNYCYSPAGQLNEIKLNEEKYATLKSEPDMLEVDYGDYIERFATNQNGQIISYQLGRKDLPETMRTLNLTYNGQGNLTALFSPETGNVAFAYAGNKPAFMQLPGGEIKYAYDQQDRLRSVVSSWGKAVDYEYEGEHLKKILLTSANPAGESGQAYALFDQGQLIESVEENSKENVSVLLVQPHEKNEERIYLKLAHQKEKVFNKDDLDIVLGEKPSSERQKQTALNRFKKYLDNAGLFKLTPKDILVIYAPEMQEGVSCSYTFL